MRTSSSVPPALPAPGRSGHRWRAAVIGTGLIGEKHLSCLRELPAVDVVALCDVSPALAEATAERYAVPRWFSDHRLLFEELRPDVAHVTTPALTHFQLAVDALDAGAHVFIEKPITASYGEWAMLRERALQCGRRVVENHNYLFDPRVIRLDQLIRSGQFGQVSHVDVRFFQDVGKATHAFGDPNAPHPTLSLAGGAVADFLPHLAGLAHHFVGVHRSVSALWHRPGTGSVLPADEFVALIEAERGSATVGFNANSLPEGFWVTVYGGNMQARLNLYEGRLSIDRALPGASALAPVRNSISEGSTAVRSAFCSLWGKLSGAPGSYTGLWELIRQFYAALGSGAPSPISVDDIEAVNRLVADCLKEGRR